MSGLGRHKYEGDRSLHIFGETVIHEIHGYLSSKEYRARVEDAFAVELLLGNPELKADDDLYAKVLDLWEYQAANPPQVSLGADERHPGDAEVVFSFPEGLEMRLRALVTKRGRKLRSQRGTLEERQVAENRWKDRRISREFLIRLAERTRNREARAATMAG